MPIRLQALGGLHAFRDDVPLAWVPAQHVSSALLVYLTLEHDVTREQLARVFWPDEELESARHALRQALYRLRHAAGESLIEDAGDVLRLTVPVACDALEFERAVEASDFAGALALYRGAFLKDVSLSASPEFEGWTDRQRARFSRLHRRACRARIEGLVHIGAVAEAIEAARAWVTLEPFDDEAQHRLVELLAGSGQRAEALAQYERYERLLKADELEPLDETKALVALLRAGEVGVSVLAPALRPPVGVAGSTGEPLAAGEAAHAPTLASSPRRPRGRLVALIGFATVVVLVGAVASVRLLRPEGPRRTDIAVLPFEYVGDAGSYAYFAVGLHDALMTQLARVSGLTKVTGRTSVMTYQGTAKRLGQIGDELGVGSLVEASVQVVGDRLRVNVQLIDPVTESHLWAEQYDRTLDDAFRVQSDIALQIATAVGATLSEPERTAISAAPTDNPEAYMLYLQGREYELRLGHYLQDLEIALDFYEQAVAVDSTFALAFAALSQLHGWMSAINETRRRAAHRARQREAAERALRLAPDLSEARIAMASVQFYSGGGLDALKRETRAALERLPNDAGLWTNLGFYHRYEGNWDEALAALDKAVALDPLNAEIADDLGGNTCVFLHRYEEAVQWYSRALKLAPDFYYADRSRGMVWVTWQGRLDSLAAALARHPDKAESYYSALRLHWARKPDSLLALLQRVPGRAFDGQGQYIPTALYAAWAQQLRGDHTAARLAFDSALVLLDSIIALRPGDPRVHTSRGLALVGLRRTHEAQTEARWIQQPIRYPYSSDPSRGAMILAGTGQVEAALESIERGLSSPSRISVHTLRLDPGWDPIRNDPRFQALLVKYADPRPVY